MTDPSAPSFDLTTSPWLPVLRLDGSEGELSLVEVFEQAKDLRRLVGDVPTQEFALLRLLLAILHDAIDGPASADDWHELWQGGIPAAAVRAYLHDHRARFDLLHPSAPFCQVGDLHTAKNEVSSLDRLVADVPNNAPFFTMRARGTDRLGFAEAARWVVHAHAFDPSGIKSGAVGDPRVKGGKGYPLGVGWAGTLGGVYAEGDDLAETLLLNLIAADTDNLRAAAADDRPAWRREPAGPAAAEPGGRPSGLRDLYTWQSRRLRLHYDADGVHGVLVAYGDPLTPRNMHDREPMTAWRRSPAQEKKLGLPQVYLPREHDPARSAWRGLGALVTGRVRGAEQRQEAAAIVRPRVLDWIARLANDDYLDDGRLIRARIVSAVYGTQQSVIDEIVDDALTMAVVVLHDRDGVLGQTAVDAANDAEDAVTVLGYLASDLAEAAGAPTDSPRQAARDQGFGALDGPFRDWLSGLTRREDALERRAEWQREAHRLLSRIGARLVAEAGEAAWIGRVVRGPNGDMWLSAGRADLRFRAELRKALKLSVPERSTEVSA
ncbi:type I-E CRISPR-associated protein Cse1/CasA [Allonocardiopsis opalescens]|uniref:CRISPR-associated Cse1 family protein n=1 Tax=Allonocardiopsis opalescens TaxID=1144618 RepID=A0A2T0PV53_9ACTN|nr:type I-E CRISPR-associated protein Cse1/CasA [Allonocardiopsis opalescens]PRX95416.1 CRISPR-associated Cse1 family protein [Allonocardiopsis opalescens]